MNLNRRHWAVLAVVLALGLAAPPANAQDPWAALAATRAEFERAAWTADFVQSYLPAGFATGERESGRVSLALPGNLRWDYEVPYPKAFLILGAEVYAWNPGEASGRRALIEENERANLALLELDVATLRERYAAATRTNDEGRLEVVLTPNVEQEIRSATVVLDTASRRVVALGYADAEGNTSQFEFSGHRVAAEPGLFTPPSGLTWLED